MYTFSVGRVYCLRLPDGRTLGHVRIEHLVDSWAEGPFTATSNFEPFRELFEQEAQLRHEQIIPLWEKAADALQALNIQVIEEGKGPLPSGLAVFIEGTDAILGAPPGDAEAQRRPTEAGR